MKQSQQDQDVENRIENVESQLKDALAQIEALKSAQSGAQDVTLDAITCRTLAVVDDEGKRGVRLWINEYGGVVSAFGKDGGSAALGIDEDGGVVGAYGKDGEGIYLSNNRYGGSMAIFDTGGKNVVQASVAEDGGSGIEIRDKDGNQTGSLP